MVAWTMQPLPLRGAKHLGAGGRGPNATAMGQPRAGANGP
jgi:hypothetical protein